MAAGPYRIPHLRIVARTVYTNRTPAGSTRAPTGPQVCWAVELDPFTPVGSVPAVLRWRLVEVATAQLRANLGHSARVTGPGGLAVYGRAGKRCRRCDGVVEARVHGRHPRRTFWCPGCQLPPGADEASR